MHLRYGLSLGLSGFLLAGLPALAESKTGTVSGDNPSVSVSFSKPVDDSYTLSASPTGGWLFTSTFHYPGSNGWYGSGSYSASTEQLGGGHKTAFVDAASVFSVTISGT